MLSTLRKTLPVHPLSGSVALGFTAKGRPVWPVRGGADDGDTSDGDDGGGKDDTEGDKGADGDKDDNQDGGDPPALVAERDARKSAETLLAELTGRSKGEVRRLLKKGTDHALGELKSKDAGGKDRDDAPDADTIRRDAEREATEKANARIVRAEVKVLAADLFADPADAALYLDLSKYDVDDDGEVAADEIKSDLKKVLKDKPHLAKKGAALKPDRSQGQGGAGGARPTDLRELSRMSVVRKN